MRCLETRQCGELKRRRYLLDDGSRRTTYEVAEGVINVKDLKALMRKAAGARNLAKGRPRVLVNQPEKVDLVLEALKQGRTHRDIARQFGVSTKTIQRIKWGCRNGRL